MATIAGVVDPVPEVAGVADAPIGVLKAGVSRGVGVSGAVALAAANRRVPKGFIVAVAEEWIASYRSGQTIGAVGNAGRPIPYKAIETEAASVMI